MKKNKDLDIWEKGMQLAANVYELAKELPEEEKFVLSQEITQTAIAIPSNIASCAEAKNAKEDKNFRNIISGKLARWETPREIARKLGYLNEDKTNNVFKQINIIRSPLSSLNKALKTDEATN